MKKQITKVQILLKSYYQLAKYFLKNMCDRKRLEFHFKCAITLNIKEAN